MTGRQRIASVVGGVACVAVGYGFHGLSLIGSCGDTDPACPPESAPYFLAVGIGLPVAIMAGIFGPRVLGLCLFLSCGLGVLWAGIEAPVGERGVLLLGGAVVTGLALLPLALIPAQRRWLREADQAQKAGQLAE